MARAFYYDARFYFIKGRRSFARYALCKAGSANRFYYILYPMTFSACLWDLIHGHKVKRLLSNMNFVKKAFQT